MQGDQTFIHRCQMVSCKKHFYSCWNFQCLGPLFSTPTPQSQPSTKSHRKYSDLPWARHWVGASETIILMIAKVFTRLSCCHVTCGAAPSSSPFVEAWSIFIKQQSLTFIELFPTLGWTRLMAFLGTAESLAPGDRSSHPESCWASKSLHFA